MLSTSKIEEIDFLTTGIGRGHLFYLSGLRDAIREEAPALCGELTVARKVGDPTVGFLWRSIELVYRFGSREGYIGRLYNRLRRERRPVELSAVSGMLAGDLVSWARRRSGPLVVDHPLLVTLLGDVRDCRELVYIHGELVAPGESLVSGADLTIVPTPEVAEKFYDAGAAEEAVFVSGLCIERSIALSLADASEARRKRMDSRKGLTGAFFSSGAEPSAHCALIMAAVVSVIRAGENAIVFAKEGGRLARMFAERNLQSVDTLRVVTYCSIADEESQFSDAFPQLDYYVAPAHERTNWTVACGLPFFWLEPNFGSFAPLNAQVARRNCSARTIATILDASEFGRRILELRDSGELSRMNRPPRADVYGFNEGAKEILRRYFT